MPQVLPGHLASRGLTGNVAWLNNNNNVQCFLTKYFIWNYFSQSAELQHTDLFPQQKSLVTYLNDKRKKERERKREKTGRKKQRKRGKKNRGREEKGTEKEREKEQRKRGKKEQRNRRKKRKKPVKNVHEFVFTVGDTEVHDPVQQVDEVCREITVKCRYRPFKVVTAGDDVNLRQKNLHAEHDTIQHSAQHITYID